MTSVVVPSSVEVTGIMLLDSGVGMIAREEDMTGTELLREGIAGLEVKGAAELYKVDLETS